MLSIVLTMALLVTADAFADDGTWLAEARKDAGT